LTSYFGVVSQTALLAFTNILYYHLFGLCLRQCTFLFPLVRYTLEVGLFIGIGWPMSEDCLVHFFLLCQRSITP
jgi:hypothetical protein